MLLKICGITRKEDLFAAEEAGAEAEEAVSAVAAPQEDGKPQEACFNGGWHTENNNIGTMLANRTE